MYIKIDENNRVIMQIVDKFAEGLEADNVTTFKVKGVEVTPASGDEYLCFDPVMKVFYTEKVEITEEQIAKAKTIAKANEKKAKALAWLAENDWKINKRMLGEWAEDDERWVTYLADRAKARAEIDEAEAVLNV